MSLRTDVEDTLYEYAWSYDENDMDALIGTFAVDGRLDGQAPGMTPRHGHDEIRAFLQPAREHRRLLGQQPRHMLSGTVVVAESDTAVRSKCYMTLMLTLSDGRSISDHSGRYLDRLVLVEGVWKFAERLICIDRDSDFDGRLMATS